MKEKLKNRLDRIEETIMPTKRMTIYAYTDEELEQLIAEWEAEEGVAPSDKPLVIIRHALNRKPVTTDAPASRDPEDIVRD